MCNKCPEDEAASEGEEASIDPLEVLPHENERAWRAMEDNSFNTKSLPSSEGLIPALCSGMGELWRLPANRERWKEI